MSDPHLLLVQSQMAKNGWVPQSTHPLVWVKGAITVTSMDVSDGPWGPCRLLTMEEASGIPNTEDVLEAALSWGPALGRTTMSLADDDTWTLGYTAFVDGNPVNILEYVAAAGVAENIWSSVNLLVARAGGQMAAPPAAAD